MTTKNRVGLALLAVFGLLAIISVGVLLTIIPAQLKEARFKAQEVKRRADLQSKLEVFSPSSPLYDYIKLLNEPATAIPYAVKTIPEGFTRVQTGSAKEGLPFYIEGYEKRVYALVPTDWNTSDQPAIQPFYLEIVDVEPVPCDTNDNTIFCHLPEGKFWYGPFQGNLKKLLR